MADDPTKAEHEKRVAALNEANAETAKVQAMPPTPTQEENDLLALHLMHPDDKESGAPKDARSERAVPRQPPTAHTTEQHQPARSSHS
jgi:hypothetical protein